MRMSFDVASNDLQVDAVGGLGIWIMRALLNLLLGGRLLNIRILLLFLWLRLVRWFRVRWLRI